MEGPRLILLQLGHDTLSYRRPGTRYFPCDQALKLAGAIMAQARHGAAVAFLAI